MSHRVLVSDKLADEGVAILRQAENIEVDVKTGLSAEAVAEIIGDYDALIVRSATKVTPDFLKQAGKLKLVVRAGIGVDNIDVNACTERRIQVENTPFGNVVTTAEHALALLFSLARKIPQADASMKAGKWEKKRFMGRELTGKTLGVIGTGNIGKVVCKKAKALGMEVVAHDPFLTEEMATELGIESVSLAALFAQADAISVHTPLNDATRGLLGADNFARVKKGVLIVCAARGGIVDEADLITALDSGVVGGAALDVLVEEPPPADHPLLARDDVILTPHLGASTHEAQINVALDAAKQVVAFLQERAVHNPVNRPLD
jgi:D-3-phosphoglycerate dehydrogenase